MIGWLRSRGAKAARAPGGGAGDPRIVVSAVYAQRAIGEALDDLAAGRAADARRLLRIAAATLRDCIAAVEAP